MTEEGKIKQKVKELLKKFGAYYEMPVPGGYGKSGLDFNICYRGFWISVETKAPGKKATPRQEATIRNIREAGGVAIVVDGKEGFDFLTTFLVIAGLTTASDSIKAAHAAAEKQMKGTGAMEVKMNAKGKERQVPTADASEVFK
jgi:hypothetical protein